MRRALLALALLAALPAQAQRVSKVNGTKLMAICGGQACIPAVVTGAQLRDVVLKLLRGAPEKRELPAARIVLHAYKTAFPCHN